jgi:hypothetical protein
VSAEGQHRGIVIVFRGFTLFDASKAAAIGAPDGKMRKVKHQTKETGD